MTPRQQSFLAALLVEPCVTKAAKVARISEATACRYRSDPKFMGAYAQARQRQVDEGVAMLQSLTAEAVGVLKKALRSDDPMVAIKGAAEILKRTVPEKAELTGKDGQALVPRAPPIRQIVIDMGDHEEVHTAERSFIRPKEQPALAPALEGDLVPEPEAAVWPEEAAQWPVPPEDVPEEAQDVPRNGGSPPPRRPRTVTTYFPLG